MADIDTYTDGISDHYYVRLRLSRVEMISMDSERLEQILQAFRATVAEIVRGTPGRGDPGPTRPPTIPYDLEGTAEWEDDATLGELEQRGNAQPPDEVPS